MNLIILELLSGREEKGHTFSYPPFSSTPDVTVLTGKHCL